MVRLKEGGRVAVAAEQPRSSDGREATAPADRTDPPTTRETETPAQAPSALRFAPGDEVDAQHPEDPSGGFAAATIHAVAADGCYAVKVRRSRPPRRAWKPRVDGRVVAHPAPDPIPPPPQFEMRDGGWTDPLTVSEQAIRARVKEGEFSLDQMQQEGGATAQSGGSGTATMFKVGDVVEARYGGGRFGRGGLACRRGAGVVRECGWEREEAVARGRERCWGVRLLGQLM